MGLLLVCSRQRTCADRKNRLIPPVSPWWPGRSGYRYPASAGPPPMPVGIARCCSVCDAVQLSGMRGQMRSTSLLRCARIAAATAAAGALTLLAAPALALSAAASPGGWAAAATGAQILLSRTVGIIRSLTQGRASAGGL